MATREYVTFNDSNDMRSTKWITFGVRSKYNFRADALSALLRQELDIELLIVSKEPKDPKRFRVTVSNDTLADDIVAVITVLERRVMKMERIHEPKAWLEE